MMDNENDWLTKKKKKRKSAFNHLVYNGVEGHSDVAMLQYM